MSRRFARRHQWLVALGAVLLCLATAAAASAQEAPMVRTSLSADGDIWVGQRVILVVELLAPGYFSGVPAFDLPDPSGLLIMPPEGSPTISTETADGNSFTVQRHEFSVFARTAGVQTIPPLTARFHYRLNPLDAEIQPAVVKTAAVTFNAEPLPGAGKLGTVISARNLEAVETWVPEPGEAKTGDAFTRTVTFSAPDVPAMLFPPFPEATIDGFGVYPKPPEVRDLSERGQMTGTRRETIVYVCRRPGEFKIPAVQMTWWDLDTRELRRVQFPERTVKVKANPALADARSDAQSGHRRARDGFLLATLLAAAAVLLLIRQRIVQRVIDVFRPVQLATLNPIEKPPTGNHLKGGAHVRSLFICI